MSPLKASLFSKASILPAILFLILVGLVAHSFQHRGGKNTVDRAFSKYIESYTSGIISKESSIRIRLANTIQGTHVQNEELPAGILEISPSVKGKAYWFDARTIEFKPEKNLDPDKQYNASFKLGKIINVDERFQTFSFSFQTIKPDFTVTFNGLQTATRTSTTEMKLDGIIQTADAEKNDAVEKLISASYGSDVHISWIHNTYTHTHTFTIDKLTRLADKINPLTVTWDGGSLGLDKKGFQKFDIPAIGDFRVLDIKAVQDQEQYVLIQFSDAIMVGQELNGLIGISNTTEPAYTIEGSTVKVYTTERLDGSYTVFVNQGIENISHQKIAKNYTASVFFENKLPAVTIPGKGVILPSKGKLLMPFEAVNLNAVDVTIIKIYEDNVPQYFQTNDINGENELRRVGKPIVQKTIRLDGDKSVNLNKKTRFMLDIDKLFRTEPGAIYRVIIGFRRSYSLYSCKDGGPVAKPSDEDEYHYEGEYDEGDGGGTSIDEDDSFWSKYDSYYPSGWNWRDRDNPCTDSYYSKQKWATRNIIASNIGLVAKRGTDNSMVVVATDILTAQPISGIELDLLDYQKQIITKVTSDAYGLAKFDMKRKPYLLVAKRGDERGYLKLDDGSSLPLTRFNVGGEEVQNGIKGFIYGERGVWRPGDSIFVSFILEDKQNKLPADHPVELNFYNPMGQLYSTVTKTTSVDGFYSYHLATQTSDVTGTWTAKVKVGGATFTKNIKVETIMPNRLKLNLSFGGQTELTKGQNTTGTLNAKWLFGGIAQNLKAKVDAYLSSQKTTFKDFDGYDFDDPTLNFDTQVSNVFDGTLDAEGNVKVDADINVDKQAPGQLRANFMVKVFEPGGNFSINQVSMPYNVYPGYVGIKAEKGNALSGMLYTGQHHDFDIVDVDTKGRLISGQRKVTVELYKIKWSWWWDTENTVSNFTQDKYNKLVSTATITLDNGRGKWGVKINEQDWGRYLIKVKDDETGHTTGRIQYFDWPNYAQRLQEDNPTEASMLSFTSSKPKYTVGEDAVLTIPTPANGRALISFENGTRVLRTDWINTQKGETQYHFKVDETMAPNVFVNVTLLQPHSQTLNDLPIRMYGAIPLLVEDPATILKPVITMPDKIRPETKSAITVSEASGKEMTYTVAIVDEGLLDISNFKTPDPHSAFYAREALGVKTWDLFDYVIGAFGGDLERILSIGGDAGGRSLNKNVQVNRFKPVVKFMGPFHLDAGEKQTHAFTLPQYIGSVKAMVIAGHKSAYGTADKAVAVKKPLMVLATLPRVLGPSEHIQLPVTVFAMENNVKTVNIQVQSNAFSNLGGNNNSQTITFAKPGEQMVTFDLDVKNFIGVGKVHIFATSGNEKAAYDVELNVRNPNPPITKIIDKELAPGENWTTDYTAIGMNGTNKTTLEVSNIPALNLAKRLDYLIEYPHGCVEQTTSAAFPQLYLAQLTDLSAAQKAFSDRNIKAAISRLQAFQLKAGGLSYWPDGTDADDWGTNYAGHFMLAAQAAGYSTPAGFIEHWKSYQRQKALSWAPDSRSFYGADLVQAYRLYLLALAHAPELGAMNRLKEFPYISAEAKWRLAAAYKLAGQPEVGLRMISNLPLYVKPYYTLYGTYGSDLRDDAMILETLTILGQKAQAATMLRTVANRLSQDDWYSTQTTAYSLIAIAEYCGKNAQGSKLLFNYQANGARGSIASNSYIWSLPVKVQSGKAIIQNTGKNKLYVRLIQKGQPVTGENVKPIDNPDVLQMKVSYFTLKGYPVDPTKLKQGTDFVASVVIKNPGRRGRYDNMALSQIFPSGWEILNTRMMDNDEAFKSSESDYRDIRDDRVNTYFGLFEDKSVTYFVTLNAAYLGKYYQPPVYCEAMYNTSISALTKGQWVEVVK